ncbi:MAG: PBP1A family penicillin-binding protein [Synergistaceae bacterium]|nr:PBP1A family penicillin-binding protein [Synergistota bacterium]NLM71724.1 PBP1A family penicillin-binding protein [Synergistaceae bacterium]
MTWRPEHEEEHKGGKERNDRRKFSWSRAVWRTFLFFAVILVDQAILFGIAWYSWEFAVDSALRLELQGIPSIDELRSYRPMKTTVLYDAHNEPFARFFIEDRVEIPLHRVSPWLRKAVIAAEDARFMDHGGINLLSIGRAALENRRAGGIRQGGSTITQQLARTMFLTNERTLERKLREVIIAFRLESAFSKEEILEKYLNEIYFGRGAWGAETASRVYFGKSASDLSPGEAALLAALIPSPNRLPPGSPTDAAEAAKRRVLARMLETGAITEEEYREGSPPVAVADHALDRPEARVKYPYFAMRVLNETLLPKYGVRGAYGGGLHVYTTLYPDLQEAAERVAAKSKLQLAIVGLDPATGAVMALVGGRTWDESQFNRAVQAYRQPGSSFKPLVYAAAFEELGWRPMSKLDDSPLTLRYGTELWSPHNYDRKFRGRVTVERALVSSLNVPAVRAFLATGEGAVTRTVRKLGITTPYLPESPSMALGSASLTPLEMATAFSAFANGGYRVFPHMVREIRDDDGNLLFRTEDDRIRAISEQAAGEIRDTLIKAVNHGTGTAARIKGYEVFGKTGTTNDFRDAWFIGGFPGLCTAVYTGHDDRKPIGGGATGGKIAAPIWQEFMKEAADILSPELSFPKYAVTSAKVPHDEGAEEEEPEEEEVFTSPPVEVKPTQTPIVPRPSTRPWPGQERERQHHPSMIIQSETDAKLEELLKKYKVGD